MLHPASVSDICPSAHVAKMINWSDFVTHMHNFWEHEVAYPSLAMGNRNPIFHTVKYTVNRQSVLNKWLFLFLVIICIGFKRRLSLSDVHNFRTF